MLAGIIHIGGGGGYDQHLRSVEGRGDRDQGSSQAGGHVNAGEDMGGGIRGGDGVFGYGAGGQYGHGDRGPGFIGQGGLPHDGDAY